MIADQIKFEILKYVHHSYLDIGIIMKRVNKLINILKGVEYLLYKLLLTSHTLEIFSCYDIMYIILKISIEK